MVTLLEQLRSIWNSWGKREPQMKTMQKLSAGRSQRLAPPPVDIAPNDPIVAYFLSTPGAVEIDKLKLDSPALQILKAAGVKITIPLVSQGELVGLLNLGPRLSEQDYSIDDRGLLNTLTIQAAPAVRVAQLVREQRIQAQARERERFEQELRVERFEQELRVARLIQQTLLPKELPTPPGWHLSAYYQSAREVGGDFYDFLTFDDGRIGIFIGDVTDKGVPAALVMATTRSILRSVAQGATAPSKVLEQANDLLHPDIPPKMFVTCLYAILDPQNGRLWYANAGHDLPYQRHENTVSELRATGMPLGLMPGMSYEEKETLLMPGDSVLFYSDGLVEAHNPNGEMFGFPRLMSLLKKRVDDPAMTNFLLDHLKEFTGSGWEQEDDVTLVTLQRSGGYGLSEIAVRSAVPSDQNDPPENSNETWQTLAGLTIPSEPGNERLAMEQVGEAVQVLNLPAKRLAELKTAVAEATMNAMEHGNHYETDKPVTIQILASPTTLSVRITDSGGGQPIPTNPEAPDLEAKLAELQTPRGWGLFLIKNLVDEMRVTTGETHHTIELMMYLEGESHASQKS
jgi:serine phosphatase RsbU (regulator of sigma subunit)/anti-sigma regulatory factor (Ser/Thr protein kinase)